MQSYEGTSIRESYTWVINNLGTSKKGPRLDCPESGTDTLVHPNM